MRQIWMGIMMGCLWSATAMADCGGSLLSMGAYTGRPFPASVEAQLIVPLEECGRSVSGPLLGAEAGSGGHKLFVGYGANGDSSGFLSLHGGGSIRLAFWEVKNEAATVTQGRYWGPEVQVAVLLGARLGVMLPAGGAARSPTLAASLGFAY